MAFLAPVLWDVRTTGSDANGGGFDPTSGTPGTDFSVQDSAQIAYTDLVIDAATNTNCTSAGHPFTSAHVGNIINVTGGTGFTVQRVQVISVAAGVATCDKSLGTLSSTGGTGNLGGGLLTIGTAKGLIVAGNKVYIKTGTYTAAVVAWTVAGTAANPILLEGYGTAHGDLGTPPLVTSSTNSAVLMSFNASDYYTVRNIKFTHTAATRGVALQALTTGSADFRIDRCIIDGASIAWDGSSRPASLFGMTRCLIQNTTNTTAAVQQGTAGAGTGSYFHGNIFYNNSGAGVGNSGNSSISVFVGNVFAKNAKQGIVDSGTVRAQVFIVVGNTFVDNTTDGFASTETQGSGSLALLLANNVFYGNGGYGVNLTPTDSDGRCLGNYNNAYGSNNGGGTGLDRNHLSAGIGDITLTADPFTSHSGSNTDWGLNNTAGGGAACRAAAFPGSWTGITAVGYGDAGGLQHLDSGGGAAGMLFIPGLDGV